MIQISTPNAAHQEWASPTERSEAERNNRNVSDLLQELRVAGLGVQMLFGFLLALPFTVRFTGLNAGQRDLYRVSLLSAAAATVLLISPVAYHRWVFRRHEKSRLLKLANVEALVGLAMVALAICTAVCLIFTVVGSGWVFSVLAALVVAAFVFFWFALPIFDRITDDLRRQSPGVGPGH
jgi:O-antigen/teichoic acid export membrane protein